MKKYVLILSIAVLFGEPGFGYKFREFLESNNISFRNNVK